MTHFLVTGGAGFIGSHLVDRILAEGHTVTVLDNFASGKRENIEQASKHPNFILKQGSVLNAEDLQSAFQDVEIAFHLAVECVRKSIGDPISNHHVNATGTLMTLEAARKNNVKRFVYCSSSEVYGNSSKGALSEDNTVCAPTTVYGAAKLVGELYTLAYLRTYNLPVTVVRPFNAFGPREHYQGVFAEVIPRFVIRVLNGQAPIVFGDGRQGRDFTYVTDTADGLWRAAGNDKAVGEVVNLGWGRMISVREVAEEIIRQTGHNDLALEYTADRPGDIHSLIAETSKGKDLLEFEPRVPFSEGIGHYLDWFKHTHPNPASLLEQDACNWARPQ